MAILIKNRQEASAWQKEIEEKAPRLGDQAPDFELFDPHGENSIRLSHFRGQNPVAMLFGSYT